MRKSILLFFTGFLLVSNSTAQDSLRIMESLVMPSRILKQDVHFSVCLPKSYYTDKQSYPVVYLLHGLGDDHTSWLEYGRIGQYADQSVESRESTPAIFVMPEGFRTYYVNDYLGTFLYQDMFVRELVPHVDSLFRTIPDARHRALMGYSMGGFGALTLHLKYPDLFGCTVPLSISIRTDEQYMTEEAAGWDEQWGRLFGGRGLTGAARITDYYRENCPFYQLKRIAPGDYPKLHIYTDNGDKELTLCRSNEELHILMHTLGIPHEFRVRDGGHSFGYWCSALPDALRFISGFFEGKPYRGDRRQINDPLPVQENQFITLKINAGTFLAYLPDGYDNTNRSYPVAYVSGNLSETRCKMVAAFIGREIAGNKMGPVILVFLKDSAVPGLVETIPVLEEKLRIRKGYRFRALVAYQAAGLKVFIRAVNELQFSAFILSDNFLEKDGFAGFLGEISPEALKRISFYIDAPDKGNFAEGNGNAHMVLRDREVQHEYRVREGQGGFDWLMTGLPGIAPFMEKRFHK